MSKHFIEFLYDIIYNDGQRFLHGIYFSDDNYQKKAKLAYLNDPKFHMICKMAHQIAHQDEIEDYNKSNNLIMQAIRDEKKLYQIQLETFMAFAFVSKWVEDSEKEMAVDQWENEGGA